MTELLGREVHIGDLVLDLSSTPIDIDDFGIVISDDSVFKKSLVKSWRVRKTHSCMLSLLSTDKEKEIYANLSSLYKEYLREVIISIHNYSQLLPGDNFMLNDVPYIYLGKLAIIVDRICEKDEKFTYQTTGDCLVKLSKAQQHNLISGDYFDILKLAEKIAFSRERAYILKDRNWRKKGPCVKSLGKFNVKEIIKHYDIDTSLYDTKLVIDLTGYRAEGIDYTNVNYEVTIKNLCQKEGIENIDEEEGDL